MQGDAMICRYEGCLGGSLPQPRVHHIAALVRGLDSRLMRLRLLVTTMASIQPQRRRPLKRLLAACNTLPLSQVVSS
jgi:hypothetical protein